MESKILQHLEFQWFGGSRMDIAKNVTFAHVLLLDSMLKISLKFDILTCTIRPISHGPGVPIPLPPRVLKIIEDSVSEVSLSDSQLTDCSEYEYDDDQQPKPFNQDELNDFVRNLNLPKTSAFILGSRLKAKRMLCTVTTFSWYKHREKGYIRFFAMEHSLVYCRGLQTGGPDPPVGRGILDFNFWRSP